MMQATEKRPGRYVVQRTSQGRTFNETPPCDGAYRGFVPLMEGTHVIGVVEVGLLYRWFVDVSDLMEFVRKHGRCVVSVDEETGYDTIEIYDDYRE